MNEPAPPVALGPRRLRVVGIVLVAFVVVGVGIYLLGPAWIEAPAIDLVESLPAAPEVDGHLPDSIRGFWEAVESSEFGMDDPRRLVFDLSAADVQEVDALPEISGEAVAATVRSALGDHESELQEVETWWLVAPDAPWDFDVSRDDLPTYLIAAGALDRLVSATFWAITSEDRELQASLRDIWAASTYGMTNSNSLVELMLTLQSRERAIVMWSHLAAAAPPGPNELRPKALDRSFEDLLLEATRGDRQTVVEFIRSFDARAFGMEMSRWDLAFTRVALARAYHAYGPVIERIESGSTDGLSTLFEAEIAATPVSSRVIESMTASVFDRVPELRARHTTNERLLAVLIDAHAGRTPTIEAPLRRVELPDGRVVVFDGTRGPAPVDAKILFECFLQQEEAPMVVLP